MKILIKWNRNALEVEAEPDWTVGQLKAKLTEMTAVSVPKLLGIKGRDDEKLNVKPGSKVIMLGSPDAAVAAAQQKEKEQMAEQADVTDDLDFDFSGGSEIPPHLDPVNLEKVARRSSTYKLEIFNAPRPGKKLLVLDIDYTLFDHRSTVGTATELKRPFLHEFLTAAYREYDIVIWSATNMSWIEMKMGELGVYGNPNYKLVCYVCSKAMINVSTSKYGLIKVKPLGVLWSQYPEVKDRTIMFDDLRRNFLMNPQHGLKIRPFRNAPLNQATDCELRALARYLSAIARLDSFASLDHSKWEQFLQEHADDVHHSAKF